MESTSRIKGELIDILCELEKLQAVTRWLIEESPYSWTLDHNIEDGCFEIRRTFDTVTNFLRIASDYADKIHEDLKAVCDREEQKELISHDDN